MRRTSAGVSVAATSSGTRATTQSYASSMSKTGGGGSTDNRAASRATNHAAIAQATPKTRRIVTKINEDGTGGSGSVAEPQRPALLADPCVAGTEAVLQHHLDLLGCVVVVPVAFAP